MTKPIYDKIGVNYARQRQTDPRLLEQITTKLKGAKRILNIGAGAGSYEPPNMDLVALEPSSKMINQRAKDAYPVVQGSAENLPFDNNSFSHVMTILSMHHWINKPKAFKEINRVAKERFVAVSWNPEAEPFWLTRDYFPEMYEADRAIFPKLNELNLYFGDVKMVPLSIPEDCIDGFLAAYWKRPEAYLNPTVRQSISTFSKLKSVEKGLQKLKNDLDSGVWLERNKEILNSSSLDAGYVLITAKTRNIPY